MVLTYPLVGNYGVPPFTFEENGLATFMESDRIHARAIIVSDYSTNYSHWNAKESLAEWLQREKVPGITGIDTRQLTKVLREHGVMMGKIIFDDEEDNVIPDDDNMRSELCCGSELQGSHALRADQRRCQRAESSFGGLWRETQHYSLLDQARCGGDSRALGLQLQRIGVRRPIFGQRPRRSRHLREDC